MIGAADTVRYRDSAVLMGFAGELWMFATPFVSTLSILPLNLCPWVALNPMTAIVELFRFAVVGSGNVQALMLLYSFSASLIVLSLVIVLFNRAQQTGHRECLVFINQHNIATVFQVEGSSMFYRPRAIGFGALREDIKRFWGKVRLRTVREPAASLFDPATAMAGANSIWAWRNVNLKPCEGEVIGVIGMKGAGRSTLPKLFSRFTAPPQRCVSVRGQTGSLLEVGAGFHPDLIERLCAGNLVIDHGVPTYDGKVARGLANYATYDRPADPYD